MRGFWKKVNKSDDFIEHLSTRLVAAEKNKHWIEGTTVQMAIIEGMLRNEILKKIKVRFSIKENDFEKLTYFERYWDGTKVFFSTLVDYFCLLEEDEEFIKELRDYADKRNSIMHRMLMFKSEEELNKCADDAFQVGSKVLATLMTRTDKK